MARKRLSILGTELVSLPLEDTTMAALAGDGVASQRARIMADSIDCLVIVVVGDAVAGWQEAVFSYHTAMTGVPGDAGTNQPPAEAEHGTTGQSGVPDVP